MHAGRRQFHELDPDTEHPVVKYMPEQNKRRRKCLAMRLGEHEIEIIEAVMLEDFMEVESFTEGIDIDFNLTRIIVKK